MRKRNFLFLLALSAFALSSCGSDFNYSDYSFSGISDESRTEISASNEEYTSRTPYSTEFTSDPYVDPFASSETTTSSSSSSASDASIIEPDNPYENMEFALPDLPSNMDPSTLRYIEDPAKYSSLALDLASNEIASFGFTPFRAYAAVFDNDGKTIKHLVPGLAFTEWAIYDSDDERVIYSCGFLQVVEEGSTPEFLLDEDNASEGLLVFPQESSDERLFILEGNIILDGFSAILNKIYFAYEQTGAFQITVTVKPASGKLSEFANENLDLYSYDKGEYLYKASLFNRQKDIGAYAIYGEKAKHAYENAIAAIDAGIKIQEENGVAIALNNFIVFSLSLWESMQTAEQEEAIYGMLTDTLNNIEIKPNQYLVVGAKGQVNVTTDYRYDSSEERVSDGLVKMLTGMGMAVGGFVCIVATAGTASPLVLGLMATTASATFAFGMADSFEGFQDVMYGQEGDVTTEAKNLLKDGFKTVFGEENGERIYNAAKLVTSLASLIIAPTSAALSVAHAGRTAFQTVLAVARAVVVQVVKVAITTGVTNLVNRIATDFASQMGASPVLAKLIGFGTSLIAGLVTYRTLSAIDAKYNLSGLNDVRPSKDTTVKKNEDNPIRPSDPTGDLGDAVKDLYLSKDGMVARHSQSLDYTTASAMKTGLSGTYHVHTGTYSNAVEYGLLMKAQRKSVVAAESHPVEGYFNPYTHEIIIFEAALESSLKLLHTIAHLLRHAYQFEVANLLSPVIDGMRKENYITPDIALTDYLGQECEKDAEAFADYMVAIAYKAYEFENTHPGEKYVDDTEPFPDPSTFLAEGLL